MASAKIQEQIDHGAVPNHVSNVCPKGTKMHLLEVGWLEADEGFVLRGGNTSLNSTKDKAFVNKRRQLPMYCVLIDHPIEGVILWETGCGKDYPEVWGSVQSSASEQVDANVSLRSFADLKSPMCSRASGMSRNTSSTRRSKPRVTRSRTSRRS